MIRKILAVLLFAAAILIVQTPGADSCDYRCNSCQLDNAVTALLLVTALGSSTDTGEPCADLTCNDGDTCDCTTGMVITPTKFPSTMALGFTGMPWLESSVIYELSVDDTAAIDDGAATGKCMPATGNGVITLKNKKTIDFVMSGLDCTVPGVEPQGMFNGTLRINGSTTEVLIASYRIT